jgi:branched-subunit amino acid ABC-type transport system permease component
MAITVVGVLLERIVFYLLHNSPSVNSMIAAQDVMLFLEATPA